MRRRIEVGLLYSRSGSYALISEACRTGALSAIAEVNADPGLDLTFLPVERDPQGNIDLYAPFCEDILKSSATRHVIGCITSWSRKEVIPVVEKAGATLWYAVPYEGFEASDHVVYTHACPNQHLVPLLDWCFPRFGKRAYLTGSNYIWGWEMNRLARQIITEKGGEITGERYLPIGSTDVERMIAEIQATRPDFVLNMLIGPSSYEFMRALAALAARDPAFAPDRCPVLSCNLTKCELPALGAAAEGLIAAGPWFAGSRTWPPGGRTFGSSHEAACYAAVKELARLLSGQPQAETLPLSDLLGSERGGRSVIDATTHHTTLPVLIARVEQGRFQVLAELPAVAGDPYLTRGSTRAMAAPPKLRVVT